MPFVNHFKHICDCILGDLFIGHSQESPIGTDLIKLKTNSRCGIKNVCSNQKLRDIKSSELEMTGFNPRIDIDSYITGSEIHIKNCILTKTIRQPDPLAIKKKRGKIDRIHISTLEKISNEKIGVGFVNRKNHISGSGMLSHMNKVDETFKLI